MFYLFRHRKQNFYWLLIPRCSACSDIENKNLKLVIDTTMFCLFRHRKHNFLTGYQSGMHNCVIDSYDFNHNESKFYQWHYLTCSFDRFFNFAPRGWDISSRYATGRFKNHTGISRWNAST